MKPISLRLRKFKGILDGMGIEELYFDISSLNGLIAVTGGNGKGKTTFLDNLHPYRLMPFKLRKAKDWSPAAFSYYDHCYGPDAEKDFIFEQNSKRYRTLLQVDAERRKQEAFLYEQQGDKWVPLNDGKTKTYDAALEEIMGSPSLFFTSVFRGQGAKNLSDYTRGDIINLISELLNIDHIKAQGDKAGKVVDALKGIASVDQTRLSAINAELATEDGIKEEIKTLGIQSDAKKSELLVLKTSLDDNAKAVSEIDKKKVRRDTELGRLDDLNKTQTSDISEIGSINKSLSEITARTTQEKGRVEAEFEGIATETDKETKTLEKDQTTREAAWKTTKEKLTISIQRAGKISGNAVEIRKKVSEEEKTKSDLVLLKNRLIQQEGEKEKGAAKDQELAEVKKNITTTEADIKVLNARKDTDIKHLTAVIEQTKKEAEKLNGLDCNPQQIGWINESCRFIKDAVIAKGKIPGLKAELSLLQESKPEHVKLMTYLDNLQKEVKILTPEVAIIARCSEEISIIRRDIAIKDKEIEDIRKWTVLLPELEQAEKNLGQWKGESEEKGREFEELSLDNSGKLSALTLKLKAKSTEKTVRLSEIVTRYEEDARNLKEKEAVIRERVNIRTAEIGKLQSSISTDLATEISALAQKASGIRKAICEVEEALTSFSIRSGILEGKLQDLALKKEVATELYTRIGRFSKEIAKFALLAKGCSNNGIIALEIDDSGPSISATTNNLLNSCYGPRFTIRFETQSQNTDGSMKENFDITVFDAETGTEKSITEMSGGQVCWIEDAITKAICHFNIHRSDRSFDTLFTDEKDGALDKDRKREYMAVKRRAMELGTHSREFFITQTPELQEMANTILVFDKGGITVH